MTVKVAGLWELNWNNPLNESWMWTFVLREFGVLCWKMAPVTGILHNEAHTEMCLQEYPNIETMLDSDPDIIRVFVDEHGEEELHTFVHPENCVYVFGNAGSAPMLTVGAKRAQDFSIRIKTKHPSGVLWPHQCLLTILHDRMLKEV